MTIKEMQRMYRKIDKAFNAYSEAMIMVQTTPECCYNLMAVRAQAVVKAVKVLRKVCDSINRTIDDVDMHAKGLGEDNFVKWCILNNIELVSNGEQTDDTEDTEE